VRPWGIHVTRVEPGFINSTSFEHTRSSVESQRSSDSLVDPYHAHYESMAPFIARLMRASRATPDGVAARILRVMRPRRPPLRMQVTPDARVFSLLRRALPQRLYHAILYRKLPRVVEWGVDRRATAPPTES
jgi:hypothetical protein